MRDSTLRELVFVGLAVFAVVAGAGTAAWAQPPRLNPTPEESIVRIPPDWRERPPFSMRFADTRGAEHVIDLEAVRFATDRLVTLAGEREFREPDLASFPPSLVRGAFERRERDQSIVRRRDRDQLIARRGIERRDRDLFIVQATDPAAQIALHNWLARAGIRILGYIPHEAYLVRLDPQTLAAVGAQETVFWIGLFQPAYRVAPKLDFIYETDPTHRLKLRLRLDPEVYPSRDAVLAMVGAVPEATVVDVARTSHDWIVRVDGPVSLARTFAVRPGCLWVERFVDIQLSNNVARTSADVPTGRGADPDEPADDGPILDVEAVWAHGIHGEGQIAAASDTGLSTGDLDTPGSFHADFGEVGSSTNPMRVLKGYALGRLAPPTWSDDQSIPGGGHGTHTSGSIVGNGVESGSIPSDNDFPGTSYAGVAPKAQFVFQSLLTDTGGLSVPLDLNNLFLPPYTDGARVHSNSWGAPGTGEYNALSESLDEFVWNHKDMVITFSAGNSGADGTEFDPVFGCVPTATAPIDGVVDSYSINSPGTAKNVITVGASENHRPDFVYQTFTDEMCDPTGSFNNRAWGWAWCFTDDPIYSDKFADNASGLAAFSSRGPTEDLRVKPDLVAPGAPLTSTRTEVNQGFEQWGECEIPTVLQPYYVNMGGTSMANPLTAGAATLVRQYYEDGWHANDSDVTNSVPVPAEAFNPSAALVKATLINGAWDMAPGQYGTSAPQPEIPPNWDRAAGRDLPNNAEGYGRVDLLASLFPDAGWGRSAARRMHVRDVTLGIELGTQDSYSYSYGVGSGSDPLVATLVWTDPYATAGAAVTLVNDLDLEVTSPSGRHYTANRVDSYVTDPTPFVHDSRNTVEQVKVTVPETGLWTIDVVGESVPGNGDPGTMVQPFALVVSAITCAVPDLPTGAAAAANGNNRIDVTWDATGATEYHVYRGTAPGAATSLVATVAGTSFVDTTVLGGWTYYYVVKSASSTTCESASSVEVSATATGVCPLGPEFAGLASVTSSDTADCGLELSWTAASALCGGPVTYSVYRSTVSGFAPALENRIAAGLAATSFVDSSALAPGTTYYYVARATDESNGVQETNTVEHDAEPRGPAPYGPQDFEGFADGDDAGWTRGAGWAGVQSCSAHSGAKIFRFGAATCDEVYDAGLHSSAETPPIAVPAAASNVRLSFWHRWDFEGFTDGGYLGISLDGTSYTNVPDTAFVENPYNGLVFDLLVAAWTGNQSAFVNTQVNLDDACDAVPGNSGGCAGKTVYIAFTAYTNSFPLDSYTGWFIDDVLVTADVPDSCSAAPEPVPFLSARSTSGTNLLEWQNPPTGPYGAAVVRFRTDGTFPTSVADGTGVSCPGQNIGVGAYNSCTHPVTNGTSYYYSLFVDNGAGVYSSRRTVSATPFDTSGPHKWAYSTGAASLAPAGIVPGAIGTGAVFVLSNDLTLHAMNPTDAGGSWPRSGSFSWTPVSMNAPAQHRPPVVSTPVGPRIFLASQDGYAYAVDATTGAVDWTSAAKLGDVLQANPAALLSYINPTAPDLLFIGTRNAASANTLFALDPSTGTVVDQFDNGGGATAIGIITGITVDYATNYVYFTSRASGTGSSDTLWCLDATGGTLGKVWSLPVGDIDGSPVLYQGRVYVGTNAGLVKAIDATTPAVVWTYTPSPPDGPVKGYVFPDFGSSPTRLYYSTTSRVSAIDDNGSSASLAWSVTTVSNPSTPLYVIGTPDLLVGSGNGTLYQLSTANGAVTGSENLGTSGLGSPARDTINDLAHVGSTSGVVHTVTLPLP